MLVLLDLFIRKNYHEYVTVIETLLNKLLGLLSCLSLWSLISMKEKSDIIVKFKITQKYQEKILLLQYFYVLTILV